MPGMSTVGNFHCRKGDVIAGRYRVVSEAGAGNFARVVKAYDMKEDRLVAVKILRREYQRDAQFENEILAAINKHDKLGDQKVCKMVKHFMWGDLPCFTFELLGQSLKTCKYGASLSEEKLAAFAKQSCAALAFLHFTCKMIHTDLKLENILLSDPDVDGSKGIGNSWSICDLGSASFYAAKPDQDLIQTRPYRAPEVVLGSPWSFAVDMWSIGCIIYELKTGKKLFDAMNDEQQLHMFEKRIGKLPSWLVRNAHPKSRRAFFDAADRLVHTPSVFSNPYGNSASLSMSLEQELANDPLLCDFLMGCLQYDPLVRMRADEAAHHPWIMSFFGPCPVKDMVISRIPTCAYTSGAIRSPASSLVVGGTPLSKEQKATMWHGQGLVVRGLHAPLSRPTSQASASSRTSSPLGVGSRSEVSAGSLPSSRGDRHEVPMHMPHHHPVAQHRMQKPVVDNSLTRYGSAGRLPPHLQPPAGMPSAGSSFRMAHSARPSPPMPPPESSHYATSSQAYGRSAYGGSQASHASHASRMMTPPTY